MAEEDVQKELSNDVDINDDDAVQDDIGDTDDNEITLPTRTYKVENGRITSMIDGYEAMLQAIDKIMQTERFVYDIYDENYGHDLMDLIGEDRDFAIVEAERMVQEALLADDRVTDVTVDDIYIDEDGNLVIYATVSTIFGDINLEQEVS